MKIDAQLKQNVENKDNQVQMLPEDADMLSLSSVPFSEMINEQLNNCSLTNELTDLNIDYKYESLTMDFEDALFFINLTKEGQFSVENTQNGEFQNLIQTQVSQSLVTQKSVEVTNQLTMLMEKAQKTQKPVRIAFDNDVSVVIKIDKHGKITAEFIPGNQEVENYLRNNIASLRQKFDEQNLPYNDLLYRQNSRQNRQKNKDRGEN